MSDKKEYQKRIEKIDKKKELKELNGMDTGNQ